MATKKPTKPATKKTEKKRPRDVNQLAQFLVQATTERIEEQEAPATFSPEIARYMAELGRRGGKIGGKRRMETLTQQQRSEIAYKAALARWPKDRKKP